MTEDAVDPDRDSFTRAATGWERWRGHVRGRDDARRYLQAARVRQRHHVLEIGSGTGEQTLTLVRAVGASGHVVATDASEEALAIARQRLRPEGLYNVTFQVADADELEPEPGAFDAVVSGFTWMLLADPVGAAARARRGLRPDGRIAASVWGRAGEVPMVSLAMDAVRRALGVRAPRAERTTPDLSDPGTFRTVLLDAGFADVKVEPFTVALTWDSPATYAGWARDVLVDLTELLADQAPDRIDQVHAAIVEAAGPHATSDGRLALANTALMGSGRRPA